jgi:hypothetical protein
VRLDDAAARVLVRVGLQLEQVGLQQHDLEQVVEPLPVLAETSTIGTSPPKSSATRSCSVSWVLTRTGSAPSTSILLIATTTGTSAALAWAIASWSGA